MYTQVKARVCVREGDIRWCSTNGVSTILHRRGKVKMARYCVRMWRALDGAAFALDGRQEARREHGTVAGRERGRHEGREGFSGGC